MSGLLLVALGILFLIRGYLRIKKPTWGSMYKAWTIKFDTEPSEAYIQTIRHSGAPYLLGGAILLVCGLLITFL